MSNSVQQAAQEEARAGVREEDPKVRDRQETQSAEDAAQASLSSAVRIQSPL